MSLLNRIPWPLLIAACLTLGLAPFAPPHVWEKLQMLSRGELIRLMDWLDLLMHGAPWLILIAKLSVALPSRGRNSMNLKQISMLDLHVKIPQLDSADVVLDVRNPDEFSAGHVKGSLNIPHDKIANHVDRLKLYKNIYVHCRSGKRARAAAEVLLKAGFSNLTCVADSGMDDWVAAGLPVEKSVFERTEIP